MYLSLPSRLKLRVSLSVFWEKTAFSPSFYKQNHLFLRTYRKNAFIDELDEVALSGEGFHDLVAHARCLPRARRSEKNSVISSDGAHNFWPAR